MIYIVILEMYLIIYLKYNNNYNNNNNNNNIITVRSVRWSVGVSCARINFWNKKVSRFF